MQRPFLAILFSILIAWTVEAQSSKYTFDLIANDQGLFNKIITPQINNNGLVAFGARTRNNNQPLIAISDGTSSDFISVTKDANYPNLTSFSFNDKGQVAFLTETDGRTYTVSDGVTTKNLAQTNLLTNTGPVLNNNAEIVFHQDSETIAIASPDNVRIIATIDDSPYSEFLNFVDASHANINDKGDVTYSAELKTGGAVIAVDNGHSTTFIANSNDTIFETFASPVINDYGQVAYIGYKSDSTSRIVIGDGNTNTFVADETETFNNFEFLNLAINNKGYAAFLAFDDKLNTRISIGNGNLLEHVITTGDILDGRVVDHVTFTAGTLNDENDLAFFTRFKDGTSAIYRANFISTAIPEPSTWLMMVLGFAVTGLALKRRNHSQYMNA
jgi:sulfur carrier protein ThiS